MAYFNFVISQNAKWGHAGFYIDCHWMTVPENILLQKSTAYHCFILYIVINDIHLNGIHLGRFDYHFLAKLHFLHGE